MKGDSLLTDLTVQEEEAVNGGYAHAAILYKTWKYSFKLGKVIGKTPYVRSKFSQFGGWLGRNGISW